MSFFSLATFYACIEDEDEVETTIVWAQQALSHLILSGESDSEKSRELKRFLSDPDNYKSSFHRSLCLIS